MAKKLLSLDDLYAFYSTHKRSTHFSSKATDDEIVVQIDGSINFEKSEDDDSESLSRVTLQACHTGVNLNSSSISDEVMTSALPSFSNRPILGYIWKDENGEFQFEGHNAHIENDEDGESHLEYDEVPIGIIPESCNAHLEYDEDKEKNYVVVDGLIFDDYSHAIDILKRDEELSVSVEISLREFSYNAKEKVLEIENFYFSGVTILGKHQSDSSNVLPGMAGSNIKLKDFSKSNNSVFSNIDEDTNSKLVEMLERLENKIDGLTTSNINNNSRREEVEVSHFESLLAKYNKTVEDITFEYEGLSDEELDAKFAELFEDGEGTDKGEGTGEEDPAAPDNGDDTNDDEKDKVENSLKYSVTIGDAVKEFALSLSDIQYALSSLVNDTYSEDGTWYSVTVYEDGKLVMNDWWNDKYYRQSYERDGDNFSLKGDREEVFVNFLSKSEEDALAELKSSYSIISDKLSKYEEAEAFADKMTVFNDESYAQYLETPEFKELMSEESVKKFSKEELITKADVLFANLVKTSGKFSLESKSETKPAPKAPSMFAFAKQDHECSFLDGLLNK